MKKRLLLALLTLLALTGVRSASAVTFQGSYRIDVFPVESNGSLGPKLACDGTDVLSGVGELKAFAYATWSGSGPQEGFRFNFDDGMNWYGITYPSLKAGIETQVMNAVLDLRGFQSNQRITFHPETDPTQAVCPFTATNVPASDPALNVTQTPYTLPPPEFRTTVQDYSTGLPVATDGSDTTAGRVRVKVFATASVSGYYGFHEHEENSNATTGPDQDADPRNHRWWQVAYNGIWLNAGVETEVAEFVAAVGGATGTNYTTFHAKPQHAPGQGRTEIFVCFHPVRA
jgi:hypothetical protein